MKMRDLFFFFSKIGIILSILFQFGSKWHHPKRELVLVIKSKSGAFELKNRLTTQTEESSFCDHRYFK